MSGSSEPADRIALLHGLTCALLEAESAGDVARVGLERALPLLGGRTGAVYVPDRDRATLEIMEQIGIDPATLVQFRSLPADSPFPVPTAFRTGDPIWFDDTDQFKAAQPVIAQMLVHVRHSLQPLAIVPMKVSDRCVGVLYLSFAAGRPPTPENRLFVVSIAQQIGLALHRASLRTSERRLREQASALSAASADFGSSLDFQSTVEAILKRAVPAFCDGCSIDLLGADGRLHDAGRANSDPAMAALAREMLRRYPSHASVESLQLIAEGGAVLVRDHTEAFIRRNAVDDAHAELILAMGIRSSIMVPLVSRGRAYGTFNAVRLGDSPPFDADDLAFIEEFARRAGLALENARLFEQAQATARVREEFLSIAAHELKTPLHALGLHVQSLLLATEGGRALAEQAVFDKLRAARRQTARIGRQVDDLLKLSRLANGRLALERQRFDLSELAREVVARLSEAGRSPPVELDAPAPLVGAWDRDRIDQVLANLIENGLKYGGGHPVVVRVRGSDDTAEVAVIDAGIGIEAEALERIFHRFERAVSERHYGGFGLGLWIARELAEAHGGTIRVESRPGEGSTFTILLPRERQDLVT